MGRKVKCRWCANTIDKDKAFSVLKWKKDGSPAPTAFYCNEDEYVEECRAKTVRNLMYTEMESIFGDGFSFSTINAQTKDLIDKYGYETIYFYLLRDGDTICNILRNKNFNTVFGKTKYFVAILRNNLPEFEPPKEDKRNVITEEVVDSRYKAKEKRRSLDDIEDDYE